MKENEKKNDDLANFISANKDLGAGIKYLEEATEEISSTIQKGGSRMEEELAEKFGGGYGIESLYDSLSKLEDILNELYEYAGGLKILSKKKKQTLKTKNTL